MFTEIEMKKILDLYYKDNQSIRVIAKEFNTYPQKIMRAIQNSGKKLRDKSQAQALAIKSGRHKHPTKNVGHTEKARKKISEKMAEICENLSDKEREKRSKLGRMSWENKTEAEKRKFQFLGKQKLQETIKHGSKLEQFLRDKLIEAAYDVSYHEPHVLLNKKLHIDILVTNLSIAIEIDGPSHTEAIWGQESLNRARRADKQKNGLLVNAGFKIIRIKYDKNMSQYYQRKIWKKLEILLSNAEALDNITYLEV